METRHGEGRGREGGARSRRLRLRKRGETVPPPQDEVESPGRKLGRTFYCDRARGVCWSERGVDEAGQLYRGLGTPGEGKLLWLSVCGANVNIFY